MKEKLKRLLELQICDNRISTTLEKKGRGPLRIKKLKEDLEEIDKRSKESEDRLEALRKERKRIEKETQEFESKIEKSEIKLSSVKSNKEYSAALKEIEDLKSLRSSVEDKVIQFMEEIEELEKDLVVQKKKRADAAGETEKEIQVIQEETKALDMTLAELQEQRSLLTNKIEKDLLKTYLLLMERKGGQAVSPVIRGVCQTCHIGFPPQKFNELLRGDTLLTCPNCNRLIYWGEDQDFQIEQG